MEKKSYQTGRRILMSVLGVLICGISVGMFKHASLGVDPFQSLMSGLDAVIPIPIHRARMTKRGYNQAYELAKELSERIGVPVRDDIISPHKYFYIQFFRAH